MVGNRFVNPTAQPEPGRKIAFSDAHTKEVVATRGVKLRNKAAEKKAQEKKDREEYKQRFEENAEKTVQHHQQQGSKAVEIIQRYVRMAEDKTLSENKGGIAQDVEREIRQDLIQLALDLNNDENELDNGKGSVVVLSALTKILLSYRDRINKLDYELQQMKAAQKRAKLSSPPPEQGTNANEQ